MAPPHPAPTHQQQKKQRNTTSQSRSIGAVFAGNGAELIEFGTGTLKVIATGILTCVHDLSEFGVEIGCILLRCVEGTVELKHATGFR